MKRVALLLFAVCLLSACGHTNPLTIAPREVVTEQASFDSNVKNSGVIAVDENGFVVTAHFLDRHNLKHGYLRKDAGVSDAPGGNYRITAQLMQQCVEQDRLRKNKQQ